jgi:hypothetical protein
LTIKFTRHTAVSLPSNLSSLSSRAKHRFAKRKDAKSRDLELVFDFRKTTKRRENPMGLDPAHRMQHRNSLCDPLCPPWSKLLTLITATQNHRRNPRRIPQQVFFRHS